MPRRSKARQGQASLLSARRISRRSRRAVGKSRSARATSARTMRESVERWSVKARSAQVRASGPRPRSSAASARRRSRSAACSTASTRLRSVRQRWQTGAVPRRLAPHVGQRATPVVPPASRRGPDPPRGPDPGPGPDISPAFVARASRCRGDGPHGPKERFALAEGVADTSANALSRWLEGVRPATASGSASAAGSW